MNFRLVPLHVKVRSDPTTALAEDGCSIGRTPDTLRNPARVRWVIALVLTVSLCWGVVPGACADPPSLDEIRQALQSQPAATVHEDRSRRGQGETHVLTCFPAISRDPAQFICLLEAAAAVTAGGPHAVALKRTAAGWTVMTEDNPDAQPACPPVEVAQSLLRRLRGEFLSVVGEAEEGQADFTDLRGPERDRKGPLRLMCQYEVEDLREKRGDREAALYVTYVWYANGKYSMDPDIEVWH